MSVVFTVLYPRADGARFDYDYYRDHHIPLVEEVMSPAGVRITRGLNAADGGPAPFVLIAEIAFSGQEALQKGLSHPRIGEVFADVAKFTDITPLAQIGTGL